MSALDGTSIRFDIVVRIVRPETDSPAGPSRRGYPGGRKRAAGTLSGAVGSGIRARSVLFTQPGARNILQRTARPSREGAFP